MYFQHVAWLRPNARERIYASCAEGARTSPTSSLRHASPPLGSDKLLTLPRHLRCHGHATEHQRMQCSGKVMSVCQPERHQKRLTWRHILVTMGKQLSALTLAQFSSADMLHRKLMLPSALGLYKAYDIHALKLHCYGPDSSAFTSVNYLGLSPRHYLIHYQDTLFTQSGSCTICELSATVDLCTS